MNGLGQQWNDFGDIFSMPVGSMSKFCWVSGVSYQCLMPSQPVLLSQGGRCPGRGWGSQERWWGSSCLHDCWRRVCHCLSFSLSLFVHLTVFLSCLSVCVCVSVCLSVCLSLSVGLSLSHVFLFCFVIFKTILLPMLMIFLVQEYALKQCHSVLLSFHKDHIFASIIIRKGSKRCQDCYHFLYLFLFFFCFFFSVVVLCCGVQTEMDCSVS